MAKGTLAKGTQIYVDTTGSGNFQRITGVREITPPGVSTDVEETTNHDDSEPVRSFQKTLRSHGNIELVIEYALGNAVHALLRTLSETTEARNFRVTYPGSSIGSFTVSGLVTAFQFDTPVDGILKANVTIMVTGAELDNAAHLVEVLVTDDKEGVYVTGDVIQLLAIFDEFVYVDGDVPEIPITLESGAAAALYDSGSGSNVLLFEYEVQMADQADAEEMTIGSPIDPGAGSILDRGGNEAVLTFTPPDTAAFTVNDSA